MAHCTPTICFHAFLRPTPSTSARSPRRRWQARQAKRPEKPADILDRIMDAIEVRRGRGGGEKLLKYIVLKSGWGGGAGMGGGMGWALLGWGHWGLRGDSEGSAY